MAEQGQAKRALAGIRVLDLTRRYPGAYATSLLADFGAEVIKVDPPGASVPMPPVDTSTEEFAAYYSLDRNKQSIVVNLKTDGGREVLQALVKTADVLLEGFRPGVMERLGVGYQALSALNQRLIYCALSGFGATGPYAPIPAHDGNYVALAGALSLTGEKNGQPYFASNIIADMGGAAMHAAVGILIALLARDRTGRGQFVDVTYLDTVIGLMAMEASRFFLTGVVPRRGETHNTGGATWAQAFRCADGKYFTINPAERHLWVNLCRALGREDLIPFHDAQGEQAEAVIADLRRLFLTRGRDEWWQLLKDKEACVAPMLEFDETFRDPQVLHREMVLELEHPRLGKVRQVGIPIKLSDTPGEVTSLGVLAGTDTDRVLLDLGLSEARIAELRAAGAIG